MEPKPDEAPESDMSPNTASRPPKAGASATELARGRAAEDDDKTRRRRARPGAIVVGAGVAGLTAAHELAVRGFEVHVVETTPEERVLATGPRAERAADAGPRLDDDWLLPSVGGLARSQYFWQTRRDSPPETQFGTLFGHRIQLKVAALYLIENADRTAPADPREQSARFWGALVRLSGQKVPLPPYQQMYGAQPPADGDVPRPERDRPRPADWPDLRLGLCWPIDRARLSRISAKPASTLADPDVTYADTAHLMGNVWLDWLGQRGGRRGTPLTRIRGHFVARSSEALAHARTSLSNGINALETYFGVPPDNREVWAWLFDQGLIDNKHPTERTFDAPPASHTGGTVLSEQEFVRAVPAWVPKDSTAVLLMWIDDPLRDLVAAQGPLVAPGEHGYRFFPSFYEHVFDMMRRTPVQDRGGARSGLHGGQPRSTVFDNLISQPVAAFGFAAREDGTSPDLAQLDRQPGQTLSDGFRLLQTFQREIGFETRDLLRYQARMLEYATSCSARRETYESMSWFEYVRANDGYSRAFVDALEHWPTALVGMRSEEVDARTFGNAEVQILLDNIARKDVCDATLNGPTSNAWFDPWRDFLIEEHGVVFHHDTAFALALFPVDGQQEPRLLPLFQSGLDYAREQPPHPGVSKHDEATWTAREDALAQKATHRRDDLLPRNLPPRIQRQLLPTDCYVVLATSSIETYRLLRTLEDSVARERELGAAANSDLIQGWEDECRSGTLRRMWNVLDGADGERFTPSELRDAKLYGPLRHFLGAQFYDEDHDLPFVRGHLFLPQHPWGLSAISQAQFGQVRRRRGWYPGVLSFDIGSMHRPSPRGPAVWRSTRDNILDEIWSALLDAVPEERGRFRLAGDAVRPRAHLDDGLSFLASVIGTKTFPALPDAPAWFDTDEQAWDKLDPRQPDTDPRGNTWRRSYLDPWVLPPDRDLAMLIPRTATVENTNVPTESKFISKISALTPGYNSTPYLIVPPGDFAYWPGTIDPADPTRGYDIVFDNLVLAGVHTRTFTRIATMESACESARHAVNGILRDADDLRVKRQRRGGDGEPPLDRRYERTGYCDIFPLEEREPKWARFWQDIDAKLFAAGLPHMFDILKVDASLKAALPSGARRTGPTGEEILDGLANMLADGAPDPRKLSSWASPFVLQLVSTFLNARRT